MNNSYSISKYSLNVIKFVTFFDALRFHIRKKFQKIKKYKLLSNYLICEFHIKKIHSIKFFINISQYLFELKKFI